MDPVVVALTGKLNFYLVLAGVLTWPLALAVLRLYTRAVHRSMLARGQPPKDPDVETGSRTRQPVRHPASGPAVLFELPTPSQSPETTTFAARLVERPWRVALIYVVSGCVYATALTVANFVATRTEFLPIRFLTVAWVHAWPIVLSAAIVATTSRGAKALITVAYFAVLFGLAAIVMPISPDLTWGQVVMLWALYDLPTTVLLLTCLSRRFRAVAPLIFAFMFVSALGSEAVLTLVGNNVTYLAPIADLSVALDVGPITTLLILAAIGFALFTVFGWIALKWIKRRYDAKRLSDESLTLDVIWLLFAVTHANGLAFEHPLWVLAGPAAFGLYKACTYAGFSWLSTRQRSELQRFPALLLLRSFSIGKSSERLFDAIDKHWRRVGSIQLIAGVDLASRTIEPHEFLDFVSGRLARRFIDSPQTMRRRLDERDLQPDRDLRFRVNEYFCHDDMWRTVLSELVDESDAVLMDLRGFSRQNAGCVFEIHELARHFPLERIVFIVDARTDETLLADTLGDCSAGVFRVQSMHARNLRPLLRALAAAATQSSSVVASVSHNLAARA
ncbi:MAG TPA: hypothetical protein VM818_05530 [Vicinamibacterales bacterium]|nr:hypothetical protein [Vicinamibacterales bacterium]